MDVWSESSIERLADEDSDAEDILNTAFIVESDEEDAFVASLDSGPQECSLADSVPGGLSMIQRGGANIEVFWMTGELSCCVEVEASATGRQIKEAVVEATGLSRHEFQLFLGDTLICDPQPMNELIDAASTCLTIMRRTFEEAYETLIEAQFALFADERGLVNGWAFVRASLDVMTKLGLVAQVDSERREQLSQYALNRLREQGRLDEDGNMNRENFIAHVKGTKPQDRSLADEIVQIEAEVAAFRGELSQEEADVKFADLYARARGTAKKQLEER